MIVVVVLGAVVVVEGGGGVVAAAEIQSVLSKFKANGYFYGQTGF